MVSAQLSLAAEFPDQAQARMVLAAIGSGERTFTNIARAAGDIAHSTLSRAADLLISKGVVAGELPVSLSPSKERRYRITDSYLRFWLAFLGPHLAEIDRMRSDLTLARIERSWTDWRGRAVEPLVREALARLLPARGHPGRAGDRRLLDPQQRRRDRHRRGRPRARSPSSCCSSARSSGWRQASSTTTIWSRSSATGTGSPPTRSRSSPSPAPGHPPCMSMPPSPRPT